MPRVAVLLSLATFVAVAASAQTLPGAAEGGRTGLPAENAALPQVRSGALVLEGPLDPDAYTVGPGDVFTISIGGSLPRQFSVAVSADGRLAIPEIRTISAAGRSLARVRGEAQAALQGRYVNVPTDVVLGSPREFYVHVSGLVSRPGRHRVPAIARVDAAVEAAGQSLYDLASYDAPVSMPAPLWPALRNVRVEGRDGALRSVDLMRYLATGDLRTNPYLEDGDRVHVPSFDPAAEGVVVGGAVNRPGTYDMRPGDTARDLIEVAGGLDAGARLLRVRRVRLGAPAAEVLVRDAALLDLAPRDQLYAIAADSNAVIVSVEGAVRYPGAYPVVRAQTTLSELVAKAGGLREDALVRAAYLERPPRDQVTEVETQAAEETALPDVNVDSDLLRSLFGRQFYARQTATTPRVSLDPEAAISGAERVVLYEGDRLVVPFDQGLVRVYGRVARAGYVPFVQGSTAADYIRRAGGTTLSASAVYVIDASTGQLMQGEDNLVHPGDAVFVNSLPSPDTAEFVQLALQERQSEREDQRDRREARYQFVQTVLGVVGTLSTLLVVYVSLQSLGGD